MKKVGQVTDFNGRFGVITGEKEEFNFHVSDFSSSTSTSDIEKRDIVEFRVEYRPYNIKRAKNIKILQKMYIRNSQELEK